MKKRSMVSVSSNQTTHFRRSVMKQGLSIIIAVTLLLALASSGEAWQVYIKNSCDQNVNVQVAGNHILYIWHDCVPVMTPGTSYNCILPWGIGAQYFTGISYKPNVQAVGIPLDKLDCNGGFIPCLWNVNLEVVKDGNKCKYQLR